MQLVGVCALWMGRQLTCNQGRNGAFDGSGGPKPDGEGCRLGLGVSGVGNPTTVPAFSALRVTAGCTV